MPRAFSPPRAYEIGDAMHEYASLAGAGAGQYEYVRLFPIVGDDALLDRMLQAFDDGPPGFRRGLPANLLVPTGQPTGKELALPEREVVHRHPQRLAHGGKPPLREFHHYVDLQNLSLVVK